MSKIIKSLEIEVDKTTFVHPIPHWLKISKSQNIDITAALLMLGSITVPHGFTSASPARYWSWVRYFSAISSNPSLKIVTSFADLDPHQKGILSDDLGVAIPIQFLFQNLTGFKEVVDGRSFLLHNSSLLVKKPTKSKPPKIGMDKCPDFVILDNNNKWHVLECKGTQTSENYRNRQLQNAVNQKKVIEITGSVSGERLGAGLFLGNDFKANPSNLKIVDPEPQALISFGEVEQDIALSIMKRLAIARSLGLAGLVNLSELLSLPKEKIVQFKNMYSQRETVLLDQSSTNRVNNALLMDFNREQKFVEQNQEFYGREIIIPIQSEDFFKNTGAAAVNIKQGINYDLAMKIKESNANYAEEIEEIAADYLTKPSISLVSNDQKTTLNDGDLFISTIKFF